MKTLTVLISFFLIMNSSRAFDCADQFIKEAKNLLAMDHQNLLSLQFKLTSLKLAREVIEGDKRTLEEVIQDSSKKIKQADPKVLNELTKLYQKHGKDIDHKKILENFTRASYWNKKLRFYNEDISLFILAKQILEPEGHDLDEKDAAIAWLASKMSEASGPKNSSSYNHTNLSTQVASMTGAMKGISARSPGEIKKNIEEVTQKMEEGFKNLKEDLSQNFKDQCLDKNNQFLPCYNENELLSEAIRELADGVGSEKTYQFMQKEAIQKKWGGQLTFKIESKRKVLPSGDAHHFEVKNSALSFTPSKNKPAHPIRIDITNPLYDTTSAREFLKVLEDEKANLMKLYNLGNDEYNDLAVYAFGIMGNESEFGQGIEYKIKEGAPFLVTLAKKITGNGSYNSRGFTQIKQVPELIKKKYGVTSASLKVPVNSALATMGFLAEAMEELKVRAKNKSYITKDNRMDYLHYIYLGDRKEIINDTATPEFSIYAKNRKKYSEGITLYQLP